MAGKLYLLPAPLIEGGLHSIPPHTLSILPSLSAIVSERAKTTRRYLKRLDEDIDFEQTKIIELDKHGHNREIYQEAIVLLSSGQNIGFISEAGLPCIADPGHKLVRMAHQKDIEVVPIAGPSSIILALVGSGMGGQKFTFHGYLSAKKEILRNEMARLEILSKRDQCTQIFIEAPYRNQQILQTASTVLKDQSLFGIAANITSDESAFIKTKTMQKWKRDGFPNLHKQPSIFLISI